MIAFNLLSGRRGIAASVERLREAFGDRLLVLPPCAAGNTIALAAGKPMVRLSMEALLASASRLKAETGLDLAPTVARLAQAQGAQR
jgi:spermidine synthase